MRHRATIQKFESDKDNIIYGDRVQLSWEVDDTTGVYLEGDAFRRRQVSPYGQVKTTPDVRPVTTYKLSAKNTGEFSLNFNITDKDNYPVTDFTYTVEIDEEKKEFYGAEKHPKIFEVDKGLYNFKVSEKQGTFHSAEKQGEVL